MVSEANIPFVVLTGVALSGFVGMLLIARRVIKRVKEVEGQLVLVGQAAIPLNMAIQQVLVQELTHDHAPEMDALMVLLEPLRLDDTERARLLVLLDRRAKDAPTEAEREAAIILPYIMKRAHAEAQALEQHDAATRLRFVTIGPPVPPEKGGS